MPQLDFNCDLGEGCGSDAAIVPLISSASIACGGHAGDVASMRETVALCQRHGVAIGAHPSFEDRTNFGRREIALPPAAIHTSVSVQVRALAAVCVDLGAQLRHVKPHGALYNLAARDRSVADAIAAAVASVDPSLILYGLSGSCLTDAGEGAGLRVAHEVFAERAYEADGRLAPRGTPGAVIEDLDASLAQVRMLLREGVVVARNGTRVRLRADTLCLHGDRSDAAAFAAALRAALQAEGVQIRAPGGTP
ncbi:5-oxoprolinase subunit PxpA [Cognatiluteimonas profundi]|uniref:5-oxoprolinase subunit PxpA n=1 Tax=Cognatiluteimonas profundi TaxID=2594501 RepID=UPI00131E3C5C|nr:5-oxoprolinase subunit PxpA [Lysobacter profundi]